MSGPPSYSNFPWRASCDFPSEHHIVPPPGVSSSSLAPAGPPHSQNFGWSSAMVLPASGRSSGVVMGTFPPQSLMKMNLVHASGSTNLDVHPWPLLPNINTPRLSGGVYSQITSGNANVSVPSLASFGVQNISFGTHTTSYETGTTSSGIQTKSCEGAQGTGYKSQDSSHGGQIMSHGNAFCSAMGCLHSANASSMQNSYSIPHDTVELNPPHVQLKEIDPKSLLTNLKGLIAQANDAAQKVGSLVNISLKSLPRQSLFPLTGADRLGNSLVTETKNHSTPTSAVFEGEHKSDDFMTASTIFNNMLKNNNSFYNDAPGVVQVPVYADDERVESSSLPEFAEGERWVELTLHIVSGGDVHSRNTEAHGTLLPSRFWLFRKELSMWKDLPSKCSSTLLQVAAALTLVKQGDLKRWLFTHANSYGAAYSTSLANHIVVLLVFCLRAVHREATALAESLKEVELLECSIMWRSAYWLSSQFSLLYDPVASKHLVLGLFKFALESAACCITFVEGGNSQDLEEEEPSKVKCVEADPTSAEQKLPNHPCVPAPSESPGDKIIGPSCVGDGFLHLQQLAAAVLAIQSKGLVLKCQTCDCTSFQSFSSQRSAVHDMIVKKAAEVRGSRPDFQAVLEHDGLIWHRNQNHESKKNKSKEEILAEERDYKRRRMSYRGKKVQRTPSEVLRDIIEGHMEEIVAAGGIGCFGRTPQDVQLRQSGSDFAALGIKDGSDAAPTRSSSRDIERKEMGSSYSASSRHSRSEYRGSSRIDRVDGRRSTSISSRSGSQRNSSPYHTRYERSSHDHSEDKLYEKKYEPNRKDSRRERWEEREKSIHYRNEVQYSSSQYSRD